MRIGMVCPYSFDYPGGVQAHILDLARVFTDADHHVEVLGPGTELACEQDLPSYVTLSGPAVALSYNGSTARLSFGPRAVGAVRDFLQRGQFDVVHIHEPNAPSLSLITLIFAREPVVATYHASASKSLALNLARPFLRPLLERIQAGISVSEMSRRWQVEQLGGDPVLIPNGVDTARMKVGGGNWDVEKHAHIVFLGRIDEPRKGLPTLLSALEMMETSPRVTVIGGGEHTDTPGVDFVGRVSDEDKAAILNSADIYVAPNTGGESFGIVLVEAMAAGCAVVASDLEAFAAVCDAEADQPAGMLFPVGDARALATILDHLVQDSRARSALVAAGMKRAELYDWQHVSAEVMDVYITATGGEIQ
ncbi:glycosyltransferase family 4 protein [Corynebacterium tuscaniense]|uniref:glycosyltransferase family 4 protein n=1 Tax=Corynebacterium tuscaniense TaxID=302449 RepID=UPI001238B830|nr:glycosyltransferase family 4 protein [Corynebacterium tuscaniense]KAA8745096.1 glycosyltransferase family 4 protein [Corynebacterium tuscaniense]